jgi:hypothetical protein
MTDNKQPPTNVMVYARQWSLLGHFISSHYETLWYGCHPVEISGKRFMRQAKLLEFLLSFVKLNV